MINSKELIKQYGSPLYAYDEEVLKSKCMNIKKLENELQEALSKDIAVSMHYSIKANNNPAILKGVKDNGLKVDCMSPVEMEIGKRSGFNTEEMLYVCNNISEDEMSMVYKNRILICLDSISQVETWGKMYPETEIMVRINPGTTGVGHSKKVITSGKKTKFGISEENIPELLEVAEKYKLHIIGTHQHLGSLFLNDKISDYIEGIKEGLNIVKKHFKNIEIIDLGGGFGVPYKPEEEPLDLNHVAEELKPILKEFVMEYPSIKEFKFEPGRYISCEAGKLLGTVTAVKHENEMWWIGTDIGMGLLVRPSMYDSYHEITLPESTGETVTANFCGNVCESGDILGKERTVKLPKIGDTVVVHNAGAYGYSMSSNYTGRGRPAEVMITPNGEKKLIREAETYEDIVKNVVWS